MKSKLQILIVIFALLLISSCSNKHKSLPVKLDFEGDTLPGIGFYSQTWVVEDDGTGNHVLKNYGNLNEQWPGFNLGGVITDGEIKFRFKLIDFEKNANSGSGKVDLGFRRQNDGEMYILSLDPNWNRLYIAYVDKNGGWSDRIPGSESAVFFSKDIWYYVRIELKDSLISLYMDDQLLNSFNDDRYSSGSMQLGVGPKTTVQFDDISVIYK